MAWVQLLLAALAFAICLAAGGLLELDDTPAPSVSSNIDR